MVTHFLSVGQTVTIGIQCGIGRDCRVESVVGLPVVMHTVTIGIAVGDAQVVDTHAVTTVVGRMALEHESDIAEAARQPDRGRIDKPARLLVGRLPDRVLRKLTAYVSDIHLERVNGPLFW